jgi:hypothetical protein
MENEATLEKLGDSELTAATDENNAAQEQQTDAATECCNGVCVLNWKPNRAA